MAPVPRQRMAVVLAAAVADYGRLMGDDETETLATMEACRRALAALFADAGGRILKDIGGSLALEFPNAAGAVRTALAMQRLMAERNAGRPRERRLLFRIGIHLGDVAGDGLDATGPGVGVALRLRDIAEAGGICLSDPVRKRIDPELRMTLDMNEADSRVVVERPAPLRVYTLPPAADAPRPVRTSPPAAVQPSGTMRRVAATTGRVPPRGDLPRLWGLGLKVAAAALIAAIVAAISGIEHPPIVVATSWVLVLAGVVQLASLVVAQRSRPQRI